MRRQKMIYDLKKVQNLRQCNKKFQKGFEIFRKTVYFI